MTALSTPPPKPVAARRAWPDYRTVWRWHFYAGLFCIPFVLILATTGSIYLFKPQIEAWVDRPYDRLAFDGDAAPAGHQIHAALAAVPGATFQAYELPAAAHDAARVLVKQHGETVRVYVHPQTLAVLHTIPEDSRIMRILFRIHGELLMGNKGSAVVELAASWTIVMILTGLYLWWPRQATGARGAGVLYPRLTAGRRVFWRDAHAVTGVWVSGLALFLLLSGLPWAKFWGDYFQVGRRLVGAAVAQQDWTNGSQARAATTAGPAESGGEGSGHAGHGGGGINDGDRAAAVNVMEIDRVIAAVRPLNLPPPVVIAPEAKGDRWTAKSQTPNRPQRVDLVIDAGTGEIVSRTDFSQRSWVDRVVGTGIAAHEGQLFGWANQLLGLLTAVGLVLLSVSAIIMWWRRRDQGVLGAPKSAPRPATSAGLIAVVVLLGIYLPMFGLSLIAVLLLDKLVIPRFPGLRHWLGLAPSPAGAILAPAAQGDASSDAAP